MKLPSFNAAEVAHGLELCGFGPAFAEDKNALLVRARGMDFHLTLLKDGNLKGFDPVFMSYQNELHPTVRAVLAVVSHVFCAMADYEWFEGVLKEDFESNVFLAKTTYLWMMDPKKDEPQRLVLNEFLINHKAVWCQLRTTPYHNHIYENFYQHLGEMITEFKENGKLPDGIPPEDLDGVIFQCLPERSM